MVTIKEGSETHAELCDAIATLLLAAQAKDADLTEAYPFEVDLSICNIPQGRIRVTVQRVKQP